MRPRGTGRLYLRGRIWWLKYYRLGKAYWESSGSENRADAGRLLKLRLGEIEAGRFRGLAPMQITVGQLCDLVIEDYRQARKRSLPEVEWRVGKNLRPALGDVKAADFGQAHILRYISARRKAGAADATINRELAVVRRGFTLAELRAPHIPKLEEDNAREGFIEHEQYRLILEKLPIHLKALFVVGYHVGVRIGELRKIRWNQVDLSAGEIRLSGAQTKNKKPRTLPVYGDMWACLDMQKASRDQLWPDCPLVFHYLGRPIGSHIKGWSKACSAAGLPDLLFHDLRRSAVRNMERAGIPRNVAMAITGHRTESVYRRYDIVSKQDLRMAATRMEGYLTSGQKQRADSSLGTISGTLKEKTQ